MRVGDVPLRPSWSPPELGLVSGLVSAQSLDDRQITELICVRLNIFYMSFLGGVLGLLPVAFIYI